MNNADISELLAVAYASHCAECEVNGNNCVSFERFFELYTSRIQDFRQCMHADIGREING